MVEVWGHEARLIHPRHERYEIPAAAAPEAALLERAQAKGPGECSFRGRQSRHQLL